MGFATDAIHVGQEPDPSTGAIVAPIYQTSTYVQEELGKNKGYDYARTSHPNRRALERTVAKLEGGSTAYVFTSGMAAIDSVFRLLRPGDHAIISEAVYGGVIRLTTQFLVQWGLQFSFVDTSSPEQVERSIKPNTKMIYVETPTNPTLQLVDMKKAVALARRHKLVSLIDNTFASPVLQKPLDVGFDLVVHSATKYLAGHSDLIAGAVIGSQSLLKEVRHMVVVLGGSMDPDAGYMLIRGLKTLEIRVQRQCATAMAVARFLEGHPKVERVDYPGLASHPDHSLARRQMRGFGAMMAFTLKGGLPAALRFCDRTRIFQIAASLGGVESLIVLPIYTSHFGMSSKELAAAGVDPGTVRVSVGLEAPEDLIADLRQALA